MCKFILTTLRYSALALLLASPSLMASTVYKWVDDEGVVHYGTRPPAGKEASSFTPRTGHSEPVVYETPATEETSDRNAQAEANRRVTLPDPERCEAARNNLRALNNFGRVRVRNDDGSTHYLTEEEQQRRVAEAEQAIEESC